MESKGDTKRPLSSSPVKGLDASSLLAGGKVLEYYQPINDETDALVKLLLSEETGPKLSLTFDVGDAKLRVYGQPAIMSKYSPLILSLSHSVSCKEATSLGSNIPLMSPASFLNIWLYINGITGSIIPRKWGKESGDTLVGMWQWIKYLGVDVLNKKNYEWIHFLALTLHSKPNLMTMEERKDICDRLKISLNHVNANKLEKMAGVFYYLSLVCGEPIIPGQYFIQDTEIRKEEKLVTTIRASSDFARGLAYAAAFAPQKYLIKAGGRYVTNSLTLNMGLIDNESTIKHYVSSIYDKTRAFDRDTYVAADTKNSMFSGILPSDMVRGIRYFYDNILGGGEGLRILTEQDITEDIRKYVKEKWK